MVQEKEKLKLLKDLLLTDDTAFANKISARITYLEKVVNDENRLSKTVKPIVEKELSEFVQSIPQTLGPTITKTLKEEIKNSQDEVVEALFPIMGKMIKKYVAHEMQLLKESINAKTKSMFSFSGVKRKARSKFTGVPEEDLLLSELDEPKIQEIFIIENGSGIIQGHFSKTERIDKDMISGMLTAIKSFVEDAFSQKGQNLEAIAYELYNIHIQNFHKVYIAVVISGSYTIKYKQHLEDKILDFSQILLKAKNKESYDTLLMNYFKDE